MAMLAAAAPVCVATVELAADALREAAEEADESAEETDAAVEEALEEADEDAPEDEAVTADWDCRAEDP